jgi:hypothetical protein
LPKRIHCRQLSVTVVTVQPGLKPAAKCVLELWNLANACRVFEETTDTRSGIKRREATMAWTNDQDVRWNTVETELTVGGPFIC